MGLFVSNDWDSRFSERDTFNFLSAEDRNLALGNTYSFIVLSDTHIDEGDAHGLEKLASLIEDAAFVVITGDITQNGARKDVQKFIDIAKTFGVPCYPVLGNHDIYFNRWHIWKELIGSSCYRIDSPDSSTTLFILDSANASFGAPQLSWLDQELASAKSRVFVFTHTNVFVESAIDIQQLTDIRERAKIMSLLSGRCDAMFMGHVHKRIIKEVNTVQYITIEDFRSTKTYCRVYVSPEGLRYTFHTL
jgi:3',5'-cyclic AMP phosphodiesterase CpdA